MRLKLLDRDLQEWKNYWQDSRPKPTIDEMINKIDSEFTQRKTLTISVNNPAHPNKKDREKLSTYRLLANLIGYSTSNFKNKKEPYQVTAILEDICAQDTQRARQFYVAENFSGTPRVLSSIVENVQKAQEAGELSIIGSVNQLEEKDKNKWAAYCQVARCLGSTVGERIYSPTAGTITANISKTT